MNNCSTDLEGLYSFSFLLNDFITWKSRNFIVIQFYHSWEIFLSFSSSPFNLLFWPWTTFPSVSQYSNYSSISYFIQPRSLSQAPELISTCPPHTTDVSHQRSTISETWQIRTFFWLTNFWLGHSYPWSLMPKIPGSSLVFLFLQNSIYSFFY